MLDRSDCYVLNLAALEEFQPDVAEILEATSTPEGVEYATGRDGARTLLVPGTDGRPVWFGQSSMPTISAAELCAGFFSDGPSVTLPGVLTGLEPLTVARQIPAHSAVFVVDPSAVQVRLALHLHDYTGLLSAGRLVFLLPDGDSLTECLMTFFERHPGYDLPTSLLPVPQRSAAEIADLQRRLEQAGEAVLSWQARMVASYVQRLRDRRFGPLPSTPAVAVLSVDPQPASLEQVRRIGRALNKLGWVHKSCAPHTPANCHVLARLRAIEEVNADLVLFVGNGAERLRPLLPDELPMASWHYPGSPVPPTRPGGAGEGHWVFASSPELHAALLDSGLPAEAVDRCPPGADDTIYRPVEAGRQKTDLGCRDLAVLLNLPDDRPEAANVSLPSHLALWRSLQKAVRHHVDRDCDRIAEQLLDEAQTESGTTVADPHVHDHFLTLVRTRIVPATIARSTLETLLARNHHVEVWGCNWPRLGAGSDVRRGPIPIGEPLNELLNGVGVILLLDNSPLSVQTALDALAAGAAVVCRAVGRPLEQAYPELADVVPYICFYRSLSELTDAVRRLASPQSRPRRARNEAREAVVAKHSVAARLQFIVKSIGRRGPRRGKR